MDPLPQVQLLKYSLSVTRWIWLSKRLSFLSWLSLLLLQTLFSSQKHSTYHISLFFWLSDWLFQLHILHKVFSLGTPCKWITKHFGYWDSSLNIILTWSTINPVWIATTLKLLKNLFRLKGMFSPNLRILSLKNNEPTLFILFRAMTVITSLQDRSNVSLVHVWKSIKKRPLNRDDGGLLPDTYEHLVRKRAAT